MNEQLYPGSTARYNNAAQFIDAYSVDFDILSFVQEVIPSIPEAIGNRHPLDSPFDLQLTLYAAVIEAGFASQAPWTEIAVQAFAVTMIKAHKHPSILYGLLVEENLVGGFVYDVLGYNVYFP